MLFEILQNYIFDGSASNPAYQAAQHFWQPHAGRDLAQLYLAAFEQAAAEMQPRWLQYGSSAALSRTQLWEALTLKIGLDITAFKQADAESLVAALAFELYRRHIVTIDNQAVGVDDTQQLLQHLLQHAIVLLRRHISQHDAIFDQLLLEETQGQPALFSAAQRQMQDRFNQLSTQLANSQVGAGDHLTDSKQPSPDLDHHGSVQPQSKGNISEVNVEQAYGIAVGDNARFTQNFYITPPTTLPSPLAVSAESLPPESRAIALA